MNNELQHFGIKGMHWGVRRYQNEDGSYNSAGQKRYARNANGDYTGVNGKGKRGGGAASKKSGGKEISTARKVAGTAMMVGGAAMMIGSHRANVRYTKATAQRIAQMKKNAEMAKTAGFRTPQAGGHIQYPNKKMMSKTVGRPTSMHAKNVSSTGTAKTEIRAARYMKSPNSKNVAGGHTYVTTNGINVAGKKIGKTKKNVEADFYTPHRDMRIASGKPAGSAINRPSTSSAVKKTTSDYVMVNGKKVKRKTKSTSTRISKTNSEFQKSKTNARKYGAKPLNNMKDIERYFT